MGQTFHVRQKNQSGIITCFTVEEIVGNRSYGIISQEVILDEAFAC